MQVLNDFSSRASLTSLWLFHCFFFNVGNVSNLAIKSCIGTTLPIKIETCNSELEARHRLNQYAAVFFSRFHASL